MINTKIFVTRFLSIALLAVALGNSPASGQTQGAVAAIAPTSTNYSIVQRNPNSRIWQRMLLSTNAAGIVWTNLQSYSELATGVCYITNGQYADAVEEVVSVPSGAQAVQGRYQVQWALNANTPGGAVTVTTPDAKQLVSTVFGLAWYDTATGSNAPIGQLKDCNGAIVAPNQVVYSDAFSNVTADINYTYTKAGLSQDIVLRKSPPAPHSFGLSDQTTILQIYTEFINPPQPSRTAATNGNMVDNEILDFGDMKMGLGQALFLNGQDAVVTAGMVTKQWVNTNNREFLIESIPYSAIADQLQQLPQASTLKPRRGSIRHLGFLEFKPVRPNSSKKKQGPMKLAMAEKSQTRLVVDYDLLSSSTNLTLQGDSTYFVTGAVNISGTLIIEGGTVVKYTNSYAAQITATNIICETGPYSPGVFTSANDNSVGLTIAGSTGVPTNTPGVYYVNFGSLGTNSLFFRDLRFSYASFAIYGAINSIGANSITMWDCQFLNCGYALFCTPVIYSSPNPGFPINVYNVLFSGCGVALAGIDIDSGYLNVSAVNVTADQVGTFSSGNACYATNSIFTSVTNISGVSFVYCCTNSSSNGIYQTVGGGGYYLAEDSTNQNAGTTNLTAAQLADLQSLTTYPPVVAYSGWPAVWMTNTITLFPQAQRDTGPAPALGYHYPPIDYAVSMAVSNASVTVLPGTVLAACGYQYGVWLYTNGVFVCNGTATSPSYFVRYNTVQEQSNTNWETAAWNGSLATPDLSDNSSANFGFTEWAVLASDGQICSINFPVPIVLQNCQFYGGLLSTAALSISSTNCLFRRVNTTVWDAGNSISETFYNNLFLYGELMARHGGSGPFTFRDNLFDQIVITQHAGTVIDVCSNNAYVTSTNGVLTPENDDITLTAEPAYQPGALGQFYYPTTLSLIHSGSQSAPAAGLYHYTVTTNNVIEGTNVVSIGFHYVATDGNGIPISTPGDGIPDYLADANGNGIVDSGEISWSNYVSPNGLTVPNGLMVFTPLK